MTESELVRAVTDAVRAVPGLRPAQPLGPAGPSWLPRPGGDGVELTPRLVTVRVVARALPLPPLLTAAEHGIRAALAGTALAGAALRLVVCELDAAAFTKVTPVTPP
ncbi:hypothetical protein [Nocardia asteroides]|uniref:hypothetical protein n=1 Tax=Nocardia asteroides TaxID=1824 RepID=UPI001E61B214|nr:hypothetical protein [Nocardia asteroides]UGT63963.1 hypothetical protein LTT61_11935 [Nocardia asteroides]